MPWDIRATTAAAGTGWLGEVANYAALPAAADNSGGVYLVLNSTPYSWKKRSGFFRSDGVTWNRMSNVTFQVYDNELKLYDEADSTKSLDFQLSPITTGTNRTLTVADRDYNFDTPEVSSIGLIPGDSTQGVMSWNSTDRALDLLINSDVTAQIPYELFVKAKNNTGSTILNGKVVYVTGIDTDIPEITLAIANDIAIVKGVIGVATEDILTGTIGNVTRFGIVRGLDTSTCTATDILYLSDSVAGDVTKTKPSIPNYPIRLGKPVKINAVDGWILVDIEGYTQTDTTVNIEGGLNGIVTQKPNVTFVVSGGVVYADVTNDEDGTSELPLIIGGVRYLLDTLTGSGAGGAARVALTAGTADEPQINYLYIDIVATVATLTASTTKPAETTAPLGIVSVKDATTTNTDGVLSWRRYNNTVNNGTGDGMLQYITARLRKEGAVWESGVVPTVTITTNVASLDNVNVSTAIGEAWQLHLQEFSATTGTEYYIVNHPTDGIKKVTDLNAVTVIADGTAIGSDDIIGLNVFGCQSSSGTVDRIFITLPEGIYEPGFFVNEELDAVNDASNYAVTSMPSGYGFEGVVFRICRLVLRYTTASGGTWENVVTELDAGSTYQDERGLPLGTASGAGSAEAADPVFKEFHFNADQFQIPNNADWAVNSQAGFALDSNNAGLMCVRFDDTTEEGVGFTLRIPDGATNIIFKTKSRAETAPGTAQTVALGVYTRNISDNTTVGTWSSRIDLSPDVSIPTNELWQYDTWTVTLASLSLTAGNLSQIEFVRDTADTGDTLSGDWTLNYLEVAFS